MYIYSYLHTYTHTHIYISSHLHTHTYKYTHTYRHIYIHTHRNIETHVKLFVICFENSHIQMLHHVTTSQLNCDKNQITGLHKMRDTRAENHRTESSSKS